ncbi:hypothetical protein [Promicromonospora soli]
MSHEHHHHGADPRAAEPAADLSGGRSGWAAVWSAVTAGIATVAGLAPHVLHHIGLFAGVFLVTGAAGNVLFGVLGLVLSIPLLRRLYRRFGTWKAPAVALAVFSVMFSLSAFVIGPAISNGDEPPTPAPSQDVSPDEHHD